jgi:hypothetical protein
MRTRSRPPKGGQPEAQGPSRRPPKPTAAESPGAETDAFDLWLRRSLHEAFDAAVEEPIPEDILRLIEDDRAERERLRRSRQVKRDD